MIIRRNKLLFYLLFFVLSGNVFALSSMNSIVKVYAVSSPPNFHYPWQNLPDRAGTGSGCLISENRILTCAHLVRDNTFMMVRKQGDTKKYIARVVMAGNDCDLAILTVDDPHFFKGMKPLKIGDLPFLQDSVTVLGYPVGGDNISVTKGVVSRIEPTLYNYSRKWLLGAQIDAAINPGNSGGPVIKDDKLVGIVFQGLINSDNIGYMVPAPIIKHFLKDCKNASYEGFSSLGIYFQKMENPDIREWALMDNQQSGIMINHILPESKKNTKLKVNDIIIEIDGTIIANDGTIIFRKDENILFPYLIWRKYVGDYINFKVIRHGKIINIKQQLHKVNNLVKTKNFELLPSYYIYAGLVFIPLSTNYLDAWGRSKPPIELMYLLNKGEITDKVVQIVVLSKVLADDFNIGFQSYSYEVVDKVGDVTVKNLKHFIKLIEECKDKFLTITLDDHSIVVLDLKKGHQVTSGILKRYRINHDRSKNLRKLTG